MSINIYVVTHKQAEIPSQQGYIPMIVGKNDAVSYPNAVRDNTGNNISEKNPNYCELTALYWIWKNVDVDYCGLCHYRRYFTENSMTDLQRKPVDAGIAEKLLQKYDIILPYPYIVLPFSVQHQLVGTSVKEQDVQVMRDILKEKYPDYLPAYDALMNGHSFSCYNMALTSKKILDEYCAWLFDILFTLESRVNLEGQSAYEQRIYGFLSERLLNVWVRKNNLSVKYLYVTETENPSTVSTVIHRKLHYIKHKKLL